MKESTKELKHYLETNKNGNDDRYLWNIIKAVLRGKFAVIPDYFRRQKKSQINNQTIYLKGTRKGGTSKT